MAAPSFVQAGSGAIWTSGAAVTVSLTGATVGNVVVIHILQDATAGGGTTYANITGLEDLAGNDGLLTALAFANVGSPNAGRNEITIARAIATTVSVDISHGSGNDLYARWYEFSGVSTGTTLATVIENDATTYANGAATSNTIADTGVVTNGPDRLACNFVAVNDDNALDAFTGMTGGTWAEAVAEFASATGTDGAIGLQTATMASAGTIDGGSDTMAASDSWGVVGFAFLPAATATSLMLPNPYRHRMHLHAR